MSREAWGRWGADDELGALNLVGAEQRLAALSLVTEGRLVSLAQTLDRTSPVAAHRLGYGHFMNRDGGDYAAGARSPGGFQFAEDTIILPTHSGTHLDALCHVWYDDLLYNGHSANEVRSTTGAARCGIDVIPPIVTRGLLLDLTGGDPTSLSAGDRLTADDLRAACERLGLTPAAGDAVLIRTGWFERVEELGSCFFDGEPGIDVSAADWLAERDVCLVGVDNYAIEAIPFDPGSVFPVHQRLLRDFGVPLLEGLKLDELAAARTDGAFAFCGAPLPLRGATASPMHPFAIL
jgi:kynurenine formamidase